jgi:hypothetical protein
MLGADYAGYCGAGNTEQLANLLWRAEQEPEFLACLQRSIRGLQGRLSPVQEQKSWKHLLGDL